MPLLYLVRHGQASFGKTQYDVLSERGFLQCELLGEYLASKQMKFDHVFRGTMKRQQSSLDTVVKKAPDSFPGFAPNVLQEFNEHETSAIMQSQIPGLVEEDPGLAGDVALFFKDKGAFQKLFAKAMIRWASGKHDAPGAESFESFKQRVAHGLNHVVQQCGDDEKIFVMTSGGVIAMALRAALEIPDHKAVRLPWGIRNASVTILRHADGISDMLSFNSTAHLDIKNDPELLTYK